MIDFITSFVNNLHIFIYIELKFNFNCDVHYLMIEHNDMNHTAIKIITNIFNLRFLSRSGTSDRNFVGVPHTEKKLIFPWLHLQ